MEEVQKMWKMPENGGRKIFEYWCDSHKINTFVIL